MGSRNWVKMFLTTLLIGALSTLVTSFFVKHESYSNYLQPLDVFEILGLIVFFSALGFVFSLISQMGFFAYLTINQFGLGMFRGFWTTIQVVLIAFTLFDLVYFRYRASDGGTSIFGYILVAVLLLIYSWVISKWKVKETNDKAFTPALFFMVVVTSIEWVPGLRSEGGDYVWLMIIPLLLCNTYQLLILHRLTDKKEVKEGTAAGKELTSGVTLRKSNGNKSKKKKQKKRKNKK